MQNSHIMGLALALSNVRTGQAVNPASPGEVSGANAGSPRCIKIPAMTGNQLRQLLAWLEVLR